MKKCLITKKELKFGYSTKYLQNSSNRVSILSYNIEINSKIFYIETLDLAEDLICENEPIDDKVASLICYAIEKEDIRVKGVFSWDGYKRHDVINLKKLIGELLDEKMQEADFVF